MYTIPKPNTNFIVEGTHSKFVFIVADNHEDSKFVNLISLDEKVPNRVETKATANDPREYKKINRDITISN